MNWGYKLLVVIIVFFIAMGSMVYIAFQQSNEMVESNYYDKEMNYQSLINAADNLNKITSDTLIRADSTHLILTIPASLVKGFEKGQVEFLNSGEERHDMTVPIQLNTEGAFMIEKGGKLKGNYKARIRFTSASVMYYREQDINVN